MHCGTLKLEEEMQNVLLSVKQLDREQHLVA